MPGRQRGLNGSMTLDATRSFRSESMRLMASRAALMPRRQLGLGRLGHLVRVAPHTEIGRLGPRTMNRVALRTILVRGYVRFDVLIYDLAVA